MPAMMFILIVFLINLSAVPYCIWIQSLWIVRTRKRARLVILTSSDLPSPYIKGDLWLVAKELIMWLRCKKMSLAIAPHMLRERGWAEGLWSYHCTRSQSVSICNGISIKILNRGAQRAFWWMNSFTCWKDYRDSSYCSCCSLLDLTNVLLFSYL